MTTTSARTCPGACPFNHANSGGCYANGGPLALHWRQVTAGNRGGTLTELCKSIRAMPAGQLWRHNQAGDLPGVGNAINVGELRRIVAANTGRRGFTYTHKPIEHAGNAAAIAAANRDGFTVNLSGNSLEHADRLADANIGPVVAVVSESTPKQFKTPAGRRGIVCPAQVRDTNCAECGLCQQRDRDFVIGFRAHGSQKRKAETIAQ